MTVALAPQSFSVKPARNPLVSVVVPVWNDWASLRWCLKALAKQSYPAAHFEVIVVDNGSTEAPGVLDREFPNTRWLVELTPSSYAARNRGITEARGEIIALTDGDCVPSSSWLASAVAEMRRPDARILGGRIDYVNPVGRPLNRYEIWEEANTSLGNHRRLIEQYNFALTANLVVRRSVFDHVGLFDPNLKSSGDKDWTLAAVRQGERLSFAETMVVWHPRRATFDAIARKRRRVAGGIITHMKRRRARWWELALEALKGSPLDPAMYLAAFRMTCTRAELSKPGAKLGYMVLSLVMATLATMEKMRVFAGGSPQRS